MGKYWKQCQTLLGGAPKSLQIVIAPMKLKDVYSLEEKLWPTHLVVTALEARGSAWLVSLLKALQGRNQGSSGLSSYLRFCGRIHFQAHSSCWLNSVAGVAGLGFPFLTGCELGAALNSTRLLIFPALWPPPSSRQEWCINSSCFESLALCFWSLCLYLQPS